MATTTSTAAQSANRSADRARVAGTRRPVRPTGLQRHLPVLGRLDSPVTTYYLLLGATLLLLVIGLVMVLSASAVTSRTARS